MVLSMFNSWQGVRFSFFFFLFPSFIIFFLLVIFPILFSPLFSSSFFLFTFPSLCHFYLHFIPSCFVVFLFLLFYFFQFIFLFFAPFIFFLLFLSSDAYLFNLYFFLFSFFFLSLPTSCSPCLSTRVKHHDKSFLKRIKMLKFRMQTCKSILHDILYMDKLN